jgi:branched-chain amino acid transport system substrate-binding protein
VATLALSLNAAWAESVPGVTATEIKLGQTMSYTGVAAEIAGAFGKSEAAYFQMINDQGGINGRKIVLESLDDGYDPGKALELTKKLIEQDHVAAIFSPFASINLALRGYLNDNKIPQLFIADGDDLAADYKHFPYITGGVPVFRIEAQIFGRFILVNMPAAKVALMRGRDDMGDAYATGLKQGLGREYYTRIVKDVEFDDAKPALDTTLATLRASGADTLIIVAPPPISALVIAKTYEMGWPATRFLNFASSSTGILRQAGFDKAKGVITANSYLDTTDPRWIEDGSAKPFRDFAVKYLKGSEKGIGYYLAGYVIAQAMAQTLIQCGDDLSRENIMAQAENLKDFRPVGILPGISFYTSRTKHQPIVEAALQRFDGQHWIQFGDIMAGF